MTRTLWRLQQIFVPHWISMISSDQTIDWILLERPLKCYKADQIVHQLGQIAHQMIRPPIIWSSCTWNRMESPVKKVVGCLPPSSDSLQPFPEYSKMLEKSQIGDDVKRGQYQLFFFYFRPMGSIAPVCQNWLFWFWQKILSECWSKSENCHSTKTFGILDVTVIDFPYL